MNIKEFLLYATETLKNSDIETPALEAGVMLCHVLKCSRAYLYTHNDTVLRQDELEELEAFLQKRAANVPLQYLLGETEFMSLTFKVSPAVLIPRQDTEILVEKCIELLRDRIKLSNEENSIIRSVRVLDMCTGSGCIAVSIAHYCPESRVVACDVSRSALEVAKSNSERAGVQNRLEFRCGDLFEVLDGEERFELIASNPPYIETETVSGLQTEVRNHEPYIALDGGADGLDFYRKIVAEAPKFLIRGGHLAFEIGYNQAESVSRLMEKDFEEITVLKDLGGNDRVVFGIIRN